MGSGNYSHTTRATGLTLTATIYNNDHVNHITNQNFPGLDDYSTNVAQMQETADPYPASSESLATSGSDELKRIRFILSQLHPAETNWYEDPPVFRGTSFALEPGATPGTNINITQQSSNFGHNIPTITNATDLAKSGSSGSFALNAGGTEITMDITEAVVGVISASVIVHDLNASSTTAGDIWVPFVQASSNNLLINLKQVGGDATEDLTTILQAGDKCTIMICYITST